MTRPSLSPLRVGRITGSRIGGVLRCDKAPRSRSQVLRDMIREYHGLPDEFQGNEMTDWGHLHEPDGIAAYEERELVSVHSAQLTVVHPFYDFLAYTSDGLVGNDGMIEVKCPWKSRYGSIWQRPAYEAQVRLGMEVLGRKWCDFIIWRSRGPIIVDHVEYDPTWLPRVMPELAKFMGEYQVGVTDPEVLKTEQARGRAVELTEPDQFLTDRERYFELQRLEEAVEAEMAEIKERVGTVLGDNELALVNGKPVAKWQYRAGSSTFDRVSFRKEHPDLESHYTTTGAPSRYPVLLEGEESA